MKKILIADDDQMITKGLMIRLQDEGFEISLAHDGVTAVKKAVSELPDLILLDISMPAGNGMHVMETLRKNPKSATIPVVFITGKSNPKYFDEAMEMGAIGYLSKPLEPNEYLPLIHSAIERPMTQTDNGTERTIA